VLSIIAMLDPRMVAAKTHGCDRRAQGVLAGCDRITASSQGDLPMFAMMEV
jgi:hypothetical protein